MQDNVHFTDNGLKKLGLSGFPNEFSNHFTLIQ